MPKSQPIPSDSWDSTLYNNAAALKIILAVVPSNEFQIAPETLNSSVCLC